jgi:tetratricopeptide (TPR) repeat protein
MSTDSLTELDVTPAQALELPGRELNRLLSFFARWQRLEALHTCLDLLIPAYPHLVSLLDLRVRALISQGRGDEAVTVMKKRIEIKTSVSARILLARAHLADQDLEAARQIAAELVERRPDSIAAWGLLADTAIAQGHIQVAQEACQRLHDLNPHSRAYLLKMLALYQASDDWVTASGYAVRLLRTATADDPLPVDYVRTLVHYFQASGEPTRVAELQAELARRYPVERAEIENAIAPGPRGAAPAPAKPRRPAPTPTAARPPRTISLALPACFPASSRRWPASCAARTCWPFCRPAAASRCAINCRPCWPSAAPRSSSRPSSP